MRDKNSKLLIDAKFKLYDFAIRHKIGIGEAAEALIQTALGANKSALAQCFRLAEELLLKEEENLGRPRKFNEKVTF